MIPPCRCGRRRVRDRAGVLHELCGTCRRLDAEAQERARVRDSMRRLRADKKLRNTDAPPTVAPHGEGARAPQTGSRSR